MFSRFIIRSSTRPLIRFMSTQPELQLLLDAKCRSCGIKLQQDNPKEPGFFRPGSSLEDTNQPKEKFVSESNRKYNQFLSQLDPSDRNLLINNFSAPKHDPKPEPVREPAPEQELESKKTRVPVTDNIDVMPDTHPAELIEGQYTCVRCRDIHHRSKFTMNEKEFVIDSMDEVLAQIPNDSPLVYVFNAMDFPMGINPEIFKHRNPRDLYFIMTKTDNLFSKSSGATHDYCKTFLNDYLGQKYRVPPENIFIASGKKRWRVKRLYEFIPNYSYFVGYTNCGKSTLIKSVKVAEELKKFPEYTNVKDFGKTDKLIDKTFAKIGPGISHLPGFTREIMPVYINGEKTIYDVPGFTSNKDLRNICQQLDSKAIAHMFRGKVAQKAGDYKSRYFTAKGPHVLSIEGIAFLELPANTMYQIRNVTDLKLHEFKNIAKVESVLQNIPPAMYPSFLLESKTPELSQLNKLYVPPFYGTIDLVLENIGYINIKPVGAKKTNDLIKVYLHPSVRAVIRQPIMEYINKTFTGRDDRGEPLPKADWVKKSTFDLKRYNNDEPFSSRLLTEDAVTTDCVVDENTKYDFWKE